jgi:hypothetical protein
MSVITLEDVVRDAIDDGFKQVVAQLTKNRIDGTMSEQKFSGVVFDALKQRRSAIDAVNKLLGINVDQAGK